MAIVDVELTAVGGRITTWVPNELYVHAWERMHDALVL